MPRFSERVGAVPAATTIQIGSINDELKNSLWNIMHRLYENNEHPYWRMVARSVAEFQRKVPVDMVPTEGYKCRLWMKTYFYELPWNGVYDLIEYIASTHRQMTRTDTVSRRDYINHAYSNEDVIELFNIVLERELSGYRFVSGVLTLISNQAEIEEIDQAVQDSAAHGLGGASEHIRSALSLLGKKPDPDYRNAIKEAISAVESVAKQLTGGKSQGLDPALEALSRKTNMHRALKAAFKSLYGFTSDEGGIRHAMMEEPNVGFAEAKYMIVACSAFVNYLIQKSDEAGLL